MDETGEDATHGLNSEGEGSHIEEEDVLDVTGEHGSLDSGSDGDGLIGVNTTVGGLAEEV